MVVQVGGYLMAKPKPDPKLLRCIWRIRLVIRLEVISWNLVFRVGYVMNVSSMIEFFGGNTQLDFGRSL